MGSILGCLLGSFLGFILGGKDGGIIGGLIGAFIGGVCRFDFTNLFKPCCKKVRFIPNFQSFRSYKLHPEYIFFFQCVAQDINTDVAVSMGSIETHIDTLE